MKEVVIVAAVRTPVGRFQGALADLAAIDLGALAVAEAVHRAGIDAGAVDECVMGCVISAGLGQNPARQAALRAGLFDSVSALTINMVCGSGLRAIALGAQNILLGDAEIVVAGGMESMSNAPYLLPAARKGLRMGDSSLIDSMIRDGLWCACDDQHMGMTAELVAQKYGITRQEQDAYALESHRRAAAAWREGHFDAEVVPVAVPSRKKGGVPALVLRDESVREDSSMEALGSLKSAFKSGGTVTAGNAPGVNDAAAAVVIMSSSKASELGLKPLATIRAHAVSGVEPRWVMMAPVTGVRKVLQKAGWTNDDVDLYELNEAFSVQALAVTQELGLPLSKVNVNGGAVAIGHPIGASGARIFVTLIHEMIRTDAKRGVAALCLGGGNSVAMAIERG
ncbi:acetyl-CoA C-acetyltransferase [Edaphobacter sp. 12200R-103]|uniref:acetyl-CoA C-acetyltransferase n=1 Tax=Edaphobacter sp. 12200R-103 TaxID=2703788 RepID=UPI00138B7956|nr:acetyl-CoA C-acetyltransferase [Edaphobacter sp. 12200R-103]QHS51892.1 acetyl-CoA C-acetyltransferase [Edaphobacter sp. 12200R-103]